MSELKVKLKKNEVIGKGGLIINIKTGNSRQNPHYNPKKDPPQGQQKPKNKGGGSTTSGTKAQQAHHQSKVIKEFRRQQAAANNSKGPKKESEKLYAQLAAKGAEIAGNMKDAHADSMSGLVGGGSGIGKGDTVAGTDRYTSVRGGSDVLSDKERKKLEMYA